MDNLDVNAAWVAGMFATGAAAANPVTAAIMGVSILSGFIGQTQKAKEEGRALREQADYIMETAMLDAKKIRVERGFAEADEYSALSDTGLASGKEAVERGSGVRAVIESNNAQAEELATDILSRGRKQATATKRRAQEAEDAPGNTLVGKTLGVLKGGGVVGKALGGLF